MDTISPMNIGIPGGARGDVLKSMGRGMGRGMGKAGKSMGRGMSKMGKAGMKSLKKSPIALPLFTLSLIALVTIIILGLAIDNGKIYTGFMKGDRLFTWVTGIVTMFSAYVLLKSGWSMMSGNGKIAAVSSFVEEYKNHPQSYRHEDDYDDNY